jgi:hypothetical protein
VKNEQCLCAAEFSPGLKETEIVSATGKGRGLETTALGERSHKNPTPPAFSSRCVLGFKEETLGETESHRPLGGGRKFIGLGMSTVREVSALQEGAAQGSLQRVGSAACGVCSVWGLRHVGSAACGVCSMWGFCSIWGLAAYAVSAAYGVCSIWDFCSKWGFCSIWGLQHMGFL